jgi:putative DNA primase/helicase
MTPTTILEKAQAKLRTVEHAQERPKALTRNDEHLRSGVSTFGEGVLIECAANIVPTSIRWLWLHWLAVAKLLILAGMPGQGKTTLALAFMSIVSAGGRWPDGSRCEAGNVLMWTGEDDPSDTLVPRLIAMNADMRRVFFITGVQLSGEVLPFDPARDMVALTEAALKIGGIRLLVVDPVVSAVAGDSHKNTEVRRALQPLVDLAANLDAAVLGISHFSKGGQGKDPTERVTGSVAFSAVARVVLVAAKVKNDAGEDRRLLARSKSNVGPDDGGFEYSLDQVELNDHPGVIASRVVWGGAVEGSARELLADAETEPDSETGAKDSAEGFLRDLLNGGPVPTKTVKSEAIDAGHAWATVRRAADALSVVRRKGGMSEGWYWQLIEGAQDRSKVLKKNGEHLADAASTFGGVDGEEVM